MNLKKFKPFVGHLFELRNSLDMKKYPPIVLIMDETSHDVLIIDNNQSGVWISKRNLRSTPLENRVFATSETITHAMTLMEKMRSELSEFYQNSAAPIESQKKLKELNKLCSQTFQELRDLATRTIGEEFAPPLPELSPSEK